MKRSLFLVLVFVFTASLVLSGCGGSKATDASSAPSTAPGENSTAAPAVEDSKPVKLTLMVGRPNYVPVYTELAKQFNGKFPNVTIDVQSAGNADKDYVAYKTLLKTQLVSGNPPDLMEGDLVGDFYSSGQFEPLDAYLDQPNEFIKDNTKWSSAYTDGILVQFKQGDGKIYNLSNDTWATGLYYNKTILQKAGIANPPVTWKEMMEDAKKIQEAGFTPFVTANDGIGGGLGIVWPWTGDSMMDSLYSGSMQNIDKNGNGLLERQEGLEAFASGAFKPTEAKYKEMMKALHDWSQYWNKDWPSTTTDKIQKIWNDGKVAFMSGGHWAYNDIKKNISELPSDKKFEFGITAFPNFDESTGADFTSPSAFVGNVSSGLSVTAKIPDDHKKWAVKFIQYFSSPAGLNAMTEGASPVLAIPIVTFADQVELPEVAKLFSQNVTNGHPLLRIADGFLYGYTDEGRAKWTDIMSSYILNSTTLDDAAKKYEDYVGPASKKQLEK